MIKRLKLGDTSVLTKQQPIYGDFTKLPSNGSDLVNTLLHAEYEFSQMPVEERKKHGYDYRSWLASIFQPVVQPVDRSIEKPIEKPVSRETIAKE